MKACYVLETSGDDSVTVYRSLHRLVKSIGRPRQYQTFRRALMKSNKFTNGDIVIRKGVFISNTHNA